MKVPLYTAQTQRQSGAITPQVSQQISAQTLNAGAAIEARSAYGSLLAEGGKKLIEIHAESQANKGLSAYRSEVRAIENAAISGDFTDSTPGEVMRKLDEVYNEYASGKKINPATGKPFFTTGLSRRMFAKEAASAHESAINNYRKEMIKQVQTAAQVNVVDEINRTVATAIDIDKTTDERDAALASLYDTGEWSGQPGLLVPSPGSKSYGRFTAEKFLALQEGTVKKVLEGTMLNKMRRQDPAEVVDLLVDGAMFDPKNDAYDPVMEKAFNQLDADERRAFVSNQITFAETQIRLDEGIRKRSEAADEQLLKDKHIKMLNLAASGDEDSMQEAIGIFEELRRQNFYEDPTSINNDKNLLGLTSKESKKEDDLESIFALEQADRMNMLTYDLVRSHSGKLTTSTARIYFGRVIAEEDEGTRNAIAQMATRIGWNEKTVDITTTSGRALGKQFDEARDQFLRWLETTPEPGQPMTGGKGSTYEMRIKKGEQLANEAVEKLNAQLQRNFDRELMNIAFDATKILKINIPEKGQVPGGGSRLRWLLDELKNIPQSQRTGVVPDTILDIRRKLEPYIERDVQ